MDWEALGAVGEVVGALAVFASLVYIAVQTRQTAVQTRQTLIALQLSGAIATNEAHSRVRLALSQNPALAAVLAKANRGEPLSDAEGIQLHNLCMERFLASVVGELTRVSGSPRAEAAYLIDFLTANPGAADEWQRQRHLTGRIAPVLSTEIDRWLQEQARQDD